MAASWRWSAAALLLTAGVGASVAAVQTAVSAAAAHPPPLRVARPSSTAPAEQERPPDKKLVVLDPGHGGSNTGARSVVDGVYEKHLTMLLARAVGDRLAKRGIEVRFTREIDEYVSLRERVLTANRLRADLFVSIHTNASDAQSQRGFETWVLTPRAVDIDARALRAEPEPAAHPGADAATALVLDDVERGLSQAGAASLAAAIQRELASRRGRDRDRGVRQSSMDVLLGATMPAALVEVGFIDHPIEGQELLEPEVQAAIADAIAAGIASRL
jgi:N-acetylmuramoyl-L-alanine amidase